MLHDPEILVLDEPAAGLDPKARLEFKSLVQILAKQNKTLLISSHILSELGEMCDQLLFIDEGQMIHQGTTDSLKFDGNTGHSVRIGMIGDLDSLLTFINSREHLSILERNKDNILVQTPYSKQEELHSFLLTLIKEGIQVCEFHRMEKRLEETFVRMVQETKK